jgi:hypothetical protein
MASSQSIEFSRTSSRNHQLPVMERSRVFQGRSSQESSFSSRLFPGHPEGGYHHLGARTCLLCALIRAEISLTFAGR